MPTFAFLNARAVACKNNLSQSVVVEGRVSH